MKARSVTPVANPVEPVIAAAIVRKWVGGYILISTLMVDTTACTEIYECSPTGAVHVDSLAAPLSIINHADRVTAVAFHERFLNRFR